MSTEQVTPEGVSLERPTLKGSAYLRDTDPTLHRAAQDVIGALKQDLLPTDIQEELFRSMNPSVQRSMIAEQSGFDEGVLATFKNNLHLVDSILRRTFNSDGTLSSQEDDGMAMEPKDVLNMSLKVTQMMIRELPKVYNMDRVQRMETALLKVMSEHLTREQQEAFLAELDRQKTTM